MDASIPYLAHRPKLLVVDDQVSNVRLLHELFRDQCDVFMATNGAQAIEVCQAQMPDLVLLDVVMEGIDGHEVCRRLKADPATRAIPIIFITAQRQEADEIAGFELGAVDFITKPINPTIVRARVRTHLTLKLQTDLLRTQAMVDGLTGVANRLKFDETLAVQWRQARREQKPMSLVMFDVDYFKRYNDRYGHQAGDQCLRSVASSTALCARRPQDLLARYGGEEFACILPSTPAEAALNIAEQMRQAVEELGLEHRDSTASSQVSASFGVASLVPDNDNEPADLVALADRALYDAKHQGRNRVCSGAA